MSGVVVGSCVSGLCDAGVVDPLVVVVVVGFSNPDACNDCSNPDKCEPDCAGGADGTDGGGGVNDCSKGFDCVAKTGIGAAG